MHELKSYYMIRLQYIFSLPLTIFKSIFGDKFIQIFIDFFFFFLNAKKIKFESKQQNVLDLEGYNLFFNGLCHFYKVFQSTQYRFLTQKIKYSVQFNFNPKRVIPSLYPLNQPSSTMLNDYMRTLCQGVIDHINNKTEIQIKKRAQAIGIRGQKIPNFQRFLFLICQHIAHYIDQHIHIGTQMDSIPFVFAVFVLHNIVDHKIKVWSSVKFIKEMEKIYRQQKKDEILEVFKPNQNLTILPFERQFSCMCNNKSTEDFSKCQRCLKVFHPSCQYQKLICNKCYLTHYFFPIDWTFYNRFGQKYQTQAYFHGKFKTFNNSDNKKIQLIAIEFDINDFADLQNAQEPQLWIKIMNFNDLSNTTQNEKWKNYTNKTSEYSMIMNSNKFEFYMNFEPLRRKYLYFRNENSLIFKLQNRIVNPKDNVLMIVCHPDYWKEENYEIGVFRMTKVTQNKKAEMDNMMSGLMEKNDERSFRLSMDQYKLLEKHSKNNVQKLLNSPIISGIPNIKKEKLKVKQSESESEGELKKKSSLELVRSYGCTHKQGFDYYEMKHNYDRLKATSRPIKKKPQKEKTFNERIADVKGEQKQGPKNRTKSFKNRAQQLKKEEKKYGKFLKCPICSNEIMSLYLLPYELKEGEEMKNIHCGQKKKIAKISGMKLEKKMFEPKRPIFQLHKKQQEDDEDYSPQDADPEDSQFYSIIPSVSEVNSKPNNEKESSYYAPQIGQQEKVPKKQPFQELEEGEMALNSEEEQELHFQVATERIFGQKHEVMSEESSYSNDQNKFESIELEQNSQNQQNIYQEELNFQKASCQAFQPTGNNYAEESQKEEKENVPENHVQIMNKQITEILMARNQIQSQVLQKRLAYVSLLSEDEESEQMRTFF